MEGANSSNKSSTSLYNHQMSLAQVANQLTSFAQGHNHQKSQAQGAMIFLKVYKKR